MKRFVCLMLLSALLLSGCSKEAQQTHFAMNTVMQFSVWGTDAEEALTICVSTVNALEDCFSVTDETSALSCLNRGEEAQIPEEYADLLQRVEELSQRTGGAFDPKLGLVSQAWGFYDEQYRVPTQEEIDAALAQEQWDLGAALKGYAGWCICRELDELKLSRAMLNLGGNIQTYGEKSDGTPWQIGIQDPDSDGNLGILSVSGTMAVVTSGDYQRYFELDGVRYHHILDPATGYPADSGLRSVTVICADGLTADCLSTALFVMGLEEGSAFWRESDDFEAVFVCTDGSVYATQGAALSGCDYEVICR